MAGLPVKGAGKLDQAGWDRSQPRVGVEKEALGELKSSARDRR